MNNNTVTNTAAPYAGITIDTPLFTYNADEIGGDGLRDMFLGDMSDADYQAASRAQYPALPLGERVAASAAQFLDTFASFVYDGSVWTSESDAEEAALSGEYTPSPRNAELTKFSIRAVVNELLSDKNRELADDEHYFLRYTANPHGDHQRGTSYDSLGDGEWNDQEDRPYKAGDRCYARQNGEYQPVIAFHGSDVLSTPVGALLGFKLTARDLPNAISQASRRETANFGGSGSSYGYGEWSVFRGRESWRRGAYGDGDAFDSTGVVHVNHDRSLDH